MARFDRIVVVTKPTELALLERRFASRSAVEYFLRSRGQEIGAFEDEARAYRASLDRLLESLPEVPHALVTRPDLPAFLWRDKDLAVVIGPDGLVINVAKYLDGQPIVGFNPSPETIAGTLVRFPAQRARPVLQRVLAGDFESTSIALAEARVNDGRVLHAVNDFLVGRLDQVSARYRITVGGAAERQSSSGVLVSTAVGANAWLKSILAGVECILGSGMLGKAGALDARALLGVPWHERRLVYTVREPFATRYTGAGIVFGALAPGESVVLESEMSEGGAIVSDGVVEDFVPFNAGAAVTIRSAEKQALLVAPRRGA